MDVTERLDRCIGKYKKGNPECESCLFREECKERQRRKRK